MMIKKEKKPSKRSQNGLWIVLAAVMAALLAAFIMGVYRGNILLALKQSEQYEVKGVDVSYYQGEIDWETLSQDLSFVYMKATEGSSHQDIRFEENLEGALAAELAVGAYHFFSFESSGATQAEHYIDVVGAWDGMLIPAVDVEYYNGAYEQLDKNDIQKQLHILLEELEAYYGHKPVIYTTMSAYQALIRGEYEDYPLWIRNVYYQPIFSAHQWVFWQYNHKGILEGYSGEEKYIDQNVFRGNREELEEYRIYYPGE